MSDKDHLDTGAFDGTGPGADLPEALEGLFDGFLVNEEHLLHLDDMPPQAYS